MSLKAQAIMLRTLGILLSGVGVYKLYNGNFGEGIIPLCVGMFMLGALYVDYVMDKEFEKQWYKNKK